MQNLMKRVAKLLCLLGCVAGAAAPALAPASALADGSPSASVNECGGGAGNIGVRVHMPSRGAALTGSYKISVEFFDGGAWQSTGVGSGWHQLGEAGASGDAGFTFPFAAPSENHYLLLRGVAEFQWHGGAGSGGAMVVTDQCRVDGPGAG
jgi:hypothetical protein